MRTLSHCDLVHAHWVEPGFIAALANVLHHRPLVLTVHSLMPKLNRMQLLALRRADRVLFNSRYTMEQAIARGRCCKGEVVYQGYDAKLFSKLQRTGEIRSRLGIPDDATVVTAVGRMIPLKGMQVLMSAAPAILADRPKAHLVLAGDGPLRSELQAQAARSAYGDRIHLPGALSRRDVARLFADADVCVAPGIVDTTGRAESFGITMEESMASGLPCVGSRVGGIPETIGDGVTGLLIEPGNPSVLASAILQLVDDAELRQRMGRAGQMRAEEHFAWPVLARQVVEIYHQLVSVR
ncbi:MAG: glycosyltransferase family 4 protein [Pseudomonadales bacterium]